MCVLLEIFIYNASHRLRRLILEILSLRKHSDNNSITSVKVSNEVTDVPHLTSWLGFSSFLVKKLSKGKIS